jgi:hypothetical protein
MSSSSLLRKSHIALYVNALTELSGLPIEYEQWVLAARATLGQTVYGTLLENPPLPGDVIMETRNKELLHMLMTAFMHGSGMHLLQVTLVADDGHAAFKSIKEWYGSAALSRSIIDHYWKKLEGLKLDANTTTSEYVNVFQICCQKLEAKNKCYTTDTKRQRFLDQILDGDYDVVKQNLQGNSDLAFDDCVRSIRQREQDLQIDAGESLKKQSKKFQERRSETKSYR